MKNKSILKNGSVIIISMFIDRLKTLTLFSTERKNRPKNLKKNFTENFRTFKDRNPNGKYAFYESHEEAK